MIDQVEILAIERRALNAWPALENQTVGGWSLRAAGGWTKRANSANALAPSGAFATVKARAETFYADRGLPAIFRITPLAPPDADAALAAAGYTRFDPSLVLTMPLAPGLGDDRVRIEQAPTEAWLGAYAAANGLPVGMRSTHDAIVGAIAMPAAFASCETEGRAVAFGLAVLEGGMIGLFDIVTLPAERGRGFGRAVTGALLEWGRRAGATGSYIQVRSVNAAARSLYASLGYGEAYAYHYRMPPGWDANRTARPSGQR
jgi:GNAT superfamily N-acetyltransferase